MLCAVFIMTSVLWWSGWNYNSNCAHITFTPRRSCTHIPSFSARHPMIPKLYVMPWKQDMKHQRLLKKVEAENDTCTCTVSCSLCVCVCVSECRAGRDPRGSSWGVFVFLWSGASLPQSALHLFILCSSQPGGADGSSLVSLLQVKHLRYTSGGKRHEWRNTESLSVFLQVQQLRGDSPAAPPTRRRSTSPLISPVWVDALSHMLQCLCRSSSWRMRI